MNDKRLAVFPDLPTILKKGYDFNIGGGAWWSVPVNTPKDIQQKLEKALLQSFQQPAVIEVIRKWNMAYDPLNSEAVAKTIAEDYKTIGELLKKFNLGVYKK